MQFDVHSTEEWKPYPFDVRYDVSTDGRVRSAGKGRIRKPVRIKGGYLTLVFSTPNGHVCRYVHRMVLETWKCAQPADGMEASHIDGDRTNNRIRNLRWDTRSQNSRQKIQHRTDYNGQRNPAHKLEWATAHAIRQARDQLVVELAQRYGVSRLTVRRIVFEQSWRKKFE